MARLPTQWVPEAWDYRKWKHDKGWCKAWNQTIGIKKEKTGNGTAEKDHLLELNNANTMLKLK